MKYDLNMKSISDLAPMIQKREISPVELTKAILSQAETYNNQLNAYIEISREKAINTAQLAEKEIMRGKYRGVLHGIPMALKDNIYFKNQVVTMGSKIYKDFIPDYDATVVHRLKNAGVIFTGQLNLHEFAWGGTTDNPYYGTCYNPWNPKKIPGGSSGGSAVAVASDMTVASLGTDTVGSIRIPASACGIVGLKPTYGRVSKAGCFPSAWSLDHVGPMTKTVYDTAAILEAIAGYDYKDPASINVPTIQYTKHLTENINEYVVGINEDYFFQNVDSEIEKYVRKAIQNIVDCGAKVHHINLPKHRYSEYTQMITFISEASTIHHYDLQTRSEDLGEDIRFKLELGQIPSAVEYLQAQQLRREIKLEMESAFEKIDVLITPTVPAPFPDIGVGEEDFNDIRFVGPVNLTGFPAISIPVGLKDGMPVGLQIIGKPFQEETILNIAYAIEQMNPMKGMKPNLDAL